jgi:hypothetical protein
MAEEIVEITESAEAPQQEPERSRLYWFCYHTLTGLWSTIKSRPKATVTSVVVLCICCFLLRAVLHPIALGFRKNLSLILFGVIFLWLLQKLWNTSGWKGRGVSFVLAASAFVIILFAGREPYHYVQLYLKFQSLEISDLETLPLSGYERIQPLNSVYSLAHEIMTETESPQVPDFVRVGDDYNWTLAIEPAYPISRMFGHVTEILSVSGTAPSPSFGKEHRKTVSFPVGEDLLFSRNSHVSTIKSLNPYRYFNVEPADVKYIQKQDGSWVQVISLIRWKGFFFPQPVFGGVHIVEQSEESFVKSLTRSVVGVGKWIPVEKIKDHSYLVGQNLVPYSVSRHAANSFRFQSGFFSPFPGYHVGDVRIPDLAEDVNDQPFTAYFSITEKTPGKLYHYFALEPFDPDKQGLNTSLFLPADHIGPAHVYRHHERSGALTGVSAIASKVMESKKIYDWTRNRPVEHRPFIRLIDGKRRFFWLTTVVTYKEKSKERFIAGSVPEVVLTDAEYNTPVWVNPLKPDTWVSSLEETLHDVWNAGSG